MKKIKMPLIVITSFFVGSVFTYYFSGILNPVQSAWSETRNLKSNDDQFSFPSFDSDPFKHMENMRKRMDQMFSNAFFDDGFLSQSLGANNFSSSSNVEINHLEDDEYKYVEIRGEGLDKNNTKIEVESGMISISGETTQKNESQNQGSFSSSSFVSKFQQSFNVPEGVSEEDVKIDYNKNKITLKFPKSNKGKGYVGSKFSI